MDFPTEPAKHSDIPRCANYAVHIHVSNNYHVPVVLFNLPIRYEKSREEEGEEEEEKTSIDSVSLVRAPTESSCYMSIFTFKNYSFEVRTNVTFHSFSPFLSFPLTCPPLNVLLISTHSRLLVLAHTFLRREALECKRSKTEIPPPGHKAFISFFHQLRQSKSKSKSTHTHTHTHARTRKDERARCLNETDNSDITSDMILLVSDSDYVATRRQIGSAFSSLSSALFSLFSSLLLFLKIQFFRK